VGVRYDRIFCYVTGPPQPGHVKKIRPHTHGSHPVRTCTQLLTNRPQSLKVSLDTGSSDLWVADTSCTSCDPTTPLFAPSKSSSITSANAIDRTMISYGSGTVAGTIEQDVVSMGNFSVQSQTFCMLIPSMTSVYQMLTLLR
jgi:hypothetical protein